MKPSTSIMLMGYVMVVASWFADGDANIYLMLAAVFFAIVAVYMELRSGR